MGSFVAQVGFEFFIFKFKEDLELLIFLILLPSAGIISG